MQRQVIGIGLLLSLASFSPAWGLSGGITGLTTDPTGCNACHTGGSTPAVVLSGPTLVTPGSTHEYVLEIDEVGSQIFGGLNAGASGGSLTIGGSHSAATQLIGSEITHTGPKMGDGSKIRFSFLWTAPLLGGPFTLRAWGNAVNANSTSFGDRAAFSSLIVSTGSAPPEHDLVVLPVKPLNITIPTSQPIGIEKSFSIRVRNADPPGSSEHTGELVLDSSDCPLGVVFEPVDFSPKTAGNQEQVLIGSRQTKVAKVRVFAAHAAVTTLSKKAPFRCSAVFRADSTASGNTDPTPSNNEVVVELNIVDAADAPGATTNEAVLRSPGSMSITIPKNAAGITRTRVLTVQNADTVPLSLGLTVDPSSCSGVSVAPIDMDAKNPGIDSVVPVNPGRSKSVKVSISVDAGQVTTSNAKAPQRCRAIATVVGPGMPDPEPTNDTATLLIEILDKNDM
jgi:hypothetical protein